MAITRRALLGAAVTLPFLASLANAQGRNGTLRYGLASYPPHLRAWVNGGATQGVIKMLTQRGLVSYDNDGNLQGELAESWSLDASNAWVFKLRPGTFFHDGSPVTAEDVKWTIEQVAAEGSPALMAIQFRILDTVEIVDATTVRIVTMSPTPLMINWLAARELPIVKQGSDVEAPVGAGPFRITATERGTSYELEAFEQYYKPGLPKLQAISCTVYGDESLRIAALQAGDVDLIESVPWQSMDAIEKDANLKLAIMDGAFQMLQFNGTSGPLADVRVRKAIAHAIRRDEIVSAAFYGRGAPLEGLPIVAGTPWYDEELAHGWAYDPALAKSLLAEAGFADGFDVSVLSTSQTSFEKTIAEVVQQCLSDVGIRATLNLPDQATRNTLRSQGQFEIFCGGSVAIDTDPDALAAALTQSIGYDLSKTKAALEAGRAEMDPAKRVEVYKDLQRAVFEEVPLVGMAWRAGGYAMRANVAGFAVLPGPLLRNSDQTIEQVSI